MPRVTKLSFKEILGLKIEFDYSVSTQLTCEPNIVTINSAILGLSYACCVDLGDQHISFHAR